MKVLLLSKSPLGAAEIDRVLLSGLNASAIDVCPSVPLALARLDIFPPDLVIVNLPPPEAGDAVRRLQEHGARVPLVTVAPQGGAAETVSTAAQGVAVAHGSESMAPHLVDAHATGEALAGARAELESLARKSADQLDAETRWLLYDVASIGHVSTTLEGEILASNDIAARLLGHFSPDARDATGVVPRPLLEAAGAYSKRPSRFELCLQRGEDEPLYWILGLALPQGGTPATVTWFLMDVSEQRLQSRRARFLRRMDALTHVLSAATAECATLVSTGGRALTSARGSAADDAEVDEAVQALSRTQAVLVQLAGFARRRARRPELRDIRGLLDQMSPVLVHVVGEDVTWSMSTGDQPLYASVDAAELEQCLAAIVTQAREALPLGGQMKLSLTATLRDGDVPDARGARPELRIAIELQGYGLQPVTVPPTVQTLVMRLGAEYSEEQPDHLTTCLALRLPRVFVTR